MKVYVAIAVHRTHWTGNYSGTNPSIDQRWENMRASTKEMEKICLECLKRFGAPTLERTESREWVSVVKPVWGPYNLSLRTAWEFSLDSKEDKNKVRETLHKRIWDYYKIHELEYCSLKTPADQRPTPVFYDEKVLVVVE